MREMMRLKYVGGRALAKLYFGRERFVFNKENSFIEKVPVGIFWDRNLFMPAPVEENKPEIPVEKKEPEQVTDDTLCSICGFKARSSYGLSIHKKAKHKGGKK